MERCLVTLESNCYRWLRNPLNPPHDPVPADLLTVFLKKEKRDFDKKLKVPLPPAFMPRKEAGGVWETSAFVISAMMPKAIWTLGRRWTVINPWPNKSGTNSVKARADIIAADLSGQGQVKIKSAPSPHPRHINILDWPTDEPGQLMAATYLVTKSKLEPCLSQ